MDSEWDWYWNKKGKNIKERRKENELWRIWWTICTTRIEKNIR